MGARGLDRRSLLLVAIFPSLAAGLLNHLWTESAYRAGMGWFFLVDALQWVVLPMVVWLFVLRTGNIGLTDFGLDFAPLRARPFEFLGLFIFVPVLLWVVYAPVEAVAYRFLWPYAGTFSYGNLVPTSLPWRTLVVC